MAKPINLSQEVTSADGKRSALDEVKLKDQYIAEIFGKYDLKIVVTGTITAGGIPITTTEFNESTETPVVKETITTAGTYTITIDDIDNYVNIGGDATIEGDCRLVYMLKKKIVSLNPSLYQGAWDASTGTSALPTPSENNNGFWYRVSVAGNGYVVGDITVSNGIAWEQFEIGNYELDEYVKKDGSTPITQPQQGVDGVDDNDFATVGQLSDNNFTDAYKTTVDETPERNTYLKRTSNKLNEFSDTRVLHLGDIIKNFSFKFLNSSTITTEGTIRRVHAKTVKYTDASTFYVSFAIETTTKDSFLGIDGPDLYATITNNKFINLEFENENYKISAVYDASKISVGALSIYNTLDNAQFSEETIINGNLIYDTLIVEESASYLKTSNDELLDRGINLDTGKNTTSGYLDINGDVVAHATAFITDYIQILPVIQYAYQGFYGFTKRFCTYDKDKNFIASYPINTTTALASDTFTTLKDEVYVRFTVRNENEFMLQFGNTQSPYEPYKTKIKSDLIAGLNGLTDIAFGDSITEVVAEYADNVAAITAGLSVGKHYRTGDLLKIVH